MSDNLIQVTDTNFTTQVINQKLLPVLVDFWAQWCGPCKIIAPMLSRMAEKYQGKLIVAQLNIDENEQTAAKYNIKSIPSLLLFEEGALIDSRIGALSEAELNAFIQKNL